MTDEERARKLCAYEGVLFGIVPMTVEQRIARENVLLDAFRAIREEAATVAEDYPQNGDNLLIYLTAKDIARKLRTHGTPGEGGMP